MNAKEMRREKIAIVTGSGRGIGAEIAVELARRGIGVVICSRTNRELKQVAALIKKNNGIVTTVKADISDEKDVKKIFRQTLKKYGKVDILINNAGVGEKIAPLEQWNKKEIDNVVRTNLIGSIYCCAELLKLRKGNNLTIINIASKTGLKGYANMAVYSASKFGVIGLTKSLAKELKKDKVYAVCPGRVDTSMYRKSFTFDKFVLKPKEIAEKIINLCLSNNKIKSGRVIKIYN